MRVTILLGAAAMALLPEVTQAKACTFADRSQVTVRGTVQAIRYTEFLAAPGGRVSFHTLSLKAGCGTALAIRFGKPSCAAGQTATVEGIFVKAGDIIRAPSIRATSVTCR